MDLVPAFLKEVIEPVVAAYEQHNPQPSSLTWLDKRALMRKHATDSHIINQAQPQSPQDLYVLEVAHQISEKMHIAPAKIIIYESEKSNAMHLNNDSLAISTAKIEQSTPQHLAVTISHEMGHQANNTQMMAVSISRAALELGAGIMAAKGAYSSINQHSNSGIATVGALIVGTVTFAATFALTEPLFSAFRREQEFAADATSAKVNGATPMIEVLEAKIVAKEPIQTNWLEQINSKHPSHLERITALKKIQELQQASI